MKKKVIPVLFFTFLFITLFTFIYGFSFKKQEQPPVTMQEYNKRVTAKDKMVLVYFHASWCTVCAKMKPVIDDVEKEYGSKLDLLRIDTDRDKEVTAEFEIDALPVLILYKNGVRNWVNVGIVDKNMLKVKLGTP